MNYFPDRKMGDRRIHEKEYFILPYEAAKP
jgi:hypothetical protein